MGQWAEQVDYTRSAYMNVEGGRRPGSPELFGRCAARFTELLGETVETDDLMESGSDRPKVSHATAGGSSTEAAKAEAETAEATQAETRGVA